MEDQILLPYPLQAGHVGVGLAFRHWLAPLNTFANSAPGSISMEVVIGIKLRIIRMLVVLYVRCPKHFERQHQRERTDVSYKLVKPPHFFARHSKNRMLCLM